MISRLLRLALPVIAYISAAAVGAGFAAYLTARKRKELGTMDAFSTDRDVSGEPSVATDNLPSRDTTASETLSSTYPFKAVDA